LTIIVAITEFSQIIDILIVFLGIKKGKVIFTLGLWLTRNFFSLCIFPFIEVRIDILIGVLVPWALADVIKYYYNLTKD